MRYLIAVWLVVTLTSCTLRSVPFQQPDKRLLALQKEKAKLQSQSDPVDRTKTGIRISELLLQLIGDAVKTGDMETMDQRLDEYLTTIHDANDTMMKTGRDAHKKPKGFKDLEIALRRQVRQLEDIGGALTFDQRDPITRARQQASEIRDQLLKALFGSDIDAPHQS